MQRPRVTSESAMLCRISTSLLLILILASPLLAQSKGKKGPKQGAEEPAPAKPAADAADPEEPAEGEDIPRVVPVFDPGSHTQSICA